MPVLLSSAPRLLQPAPAAVRQICPYEHYSLVRIDLSDFTTSGVTVADLASKGMCKGYSATITDGTYGYCVPQSDSGCTAGQGQSGESQHGLFMRFTSMQTLPRPPSPLSRSTRSTRTCRASRAARWTATGTPT